MNEAVVVNVKEVVKELLNYSLSPINYDFNQLTESEKSIIKNQETLDVLKRFVNGDINFI